MHHLKKVSVLITCGLITAFAMAANESVTAQDSHEYKIQLLKNCQVISENTMSAKQVEAYQLLQQQEVTMHQIEVPIKTIEKQMQVYTTNIEKFSALAFLETKTGLNIDKKALAEQSEAARQLEAFMAQHRHQFESLAQQGNNVAKAAEGFEQSIQAFTATLDYDQVHIITPANQGAEGHCYKGINAL
jgi:hypothetical protein